LIDQPKRSRTIAGRYANFWRPKASRRPLSSNLINPDSGSTSETCQEILEFGFDLRLNLHLPIRKPINLVRLRELLKQIAADGTEASTIAGKPASAARSRLLQARGWLHVQLQTDVPGGRAVAAPEHNDQAVYAILRARISGCGRGLRVLIWY